MANPRNLANIAPNINSSSTGSIVLKGASTSADGVGITFPATQVASTSANTLDDYEEGTWTPAIVGETTAGTGTYSKQSGRYAKIGKQVFIEAEINWSAHTGTGTMRISGLPFTPTSGIDSPLAIYAFNLALSASGIPVIRVDAGNTQLKFLQYPAGGGGASSVNMDTDAGVALSGYYTV